LAKRKKNGAQGGKSFTLLATCLLFNFKAEAENGNKSIHTSAPKGGGGRGVKYILDWRSCAERVHELRGSTVVGRMHSAFHILHSADPQKLLHPAASWCNIKGVPWPLGLWYWTPKKSMAAQSKRTPFQNPPHTRHTQRVYWPAAVLTFPRSPEDLGPVCWGAS